MALKNKEGNVDSPAGEAAEGTVIDNDTQQVIDGDAETVLDAPAPEEEAPVSTAVATTSQHLPVAGGVDNSAMMKELAQEGFEGLELDFSSFTGIVLNGGNFENAGTKQPLRSREFTCRITRTRPKWAWKSNHENDKDKEVVYSYDEHADGDPASKVSAAIAEWKKEGKGVGEVKKYMEVWGLMENCPEDPALNGCLISMSIPPTSIGRLSGYLFTIHAKKRRIDEVLTKVSTGAKVTNVDFPFTPWDFTVAQ